MINLDVLKLRMIKAGVPDKLINQIIYYHKSGIYPEMEFIKMPSQDEFRTLSEVCRLHKAKTTELHVTDIKRYTAIPYSRVLQVRKRISDTFGLDAEAVEKLYDDLDMFDLKEDEVQYAYDFLASQIENPVYRREMAKYVLVLGTGQSKKRFSAVRKAVEPHMAEEVLYAATVKGFLLYAYYNDPIKGIEYLSQRFDKTTVAEILINEFFILYCFKDDYYIYNDGEKSRLDAEIEEILEKYLKS